MSGREGLCGWEGWEQREGLCGWVEGEVVRRKGRSLVSGMRVEGREMSERE